MTNIFRYDGFLSQTLNKMIDCICLSLLWLISSMPVVTIGASTTALYYTVNKCVRHSESGIWRAFWKSYRSNFKQATTLLLVLLPLYLVLASSCYSAYVMYLSGEGSKIVPIFLLIVAAIITMWGNFIFPYLARFNDPSKRILMNCIWIALFNILWAILVMVLLVVAILLVLSFPLGLFIVPAVYMLVSGYILEHVFRKYMSPEDLAKERGLDETN